MPKVRKEAVIGEGGIHTHRLRSPTETDADGVHKHLFFIQDRLLMTDLSGEHWHRIKPKSNTIGPEVEPHKHIVTVRTAEDEENFQTEEGTEHPHELQTETTTLSGLHTHFVQLGDRRFISLLPGDLLAEVSEATKSVPALRKFKVKKAKSKRDPLEMDFTFVKRLNQSDFKGIMVRAADKATFKSLSRLNEGFQIERIILSRERFNDIGEARRFVMDHGLNVMSSNEIESQGIFTFQVHSNSRFVESTLSRVTVTDGVVVVIGLLRESELGQQLEGNGGVTEGSGADSLTENAITPEQKPSRVSGNIDEFSDDMKEEKIKILLRKYVPNSDASLEEKRKAQQFRSEEFEIEILDFGDISNLLPPDGESTKLIFWGDPVNFKFLINNADNVRKAISNFTMSNLVKMNYFSDSSKSTIAERISRNALVENISLSEDSDIWEFIPSMMKDNFRQKRNLSKDLINKFNDACNIYGL